MDSKQKKYFDANRQSWDKRTPAHVKSDFYQLEAFLKGKNVLDKIVLDGLGDVAGKSMLHLQCHFGQDSLCWSRMGAKVTGVDFSPQAIEEARKLNKKLGLDATFVESNVYDLKENLKGQFDIVFTSYGVLGWLPDMDGWAAMVNHFLKPGGIFFIAEFHPTLYLFNFDNQKIEYAYFNSGEPVEEVSDVTYTNHDESIGSMTDYFWQHPMMDPLNALLGQGLRLNQMQEYPYSPYNCFPNMKMIEEGRYVFGDFGVPIPHIFSFHMTKPLSL